MAHGSKKWIRDWRGRWKRSRNRSWRDYRGELVRQGSAWRDDCPTCPTLTGFSPWARRSHCPECQERWNVYWCRWWRKHTGMRRQELRERRADYRNLMQRARHCPELYEAIPTKYKNGWLD